MVDKQTCQGKKGQGLVEFALAVPVFLLLLIGIMEVGRIIFFYSASIAAAREAARFGSVIGISENNIPQYLDCGGIKGAGIRIGRFAGIDSDDISIAYSNDDGIYSNSCPPGVPVNQSDRIIINVETEINPLVPFIKLPSIPIKSTASRGIVKDVEVGNAGIGSNISLGQSTDVNFASTRQYVEETMSPLSIAVILNEPQINPVTVPFTISGTAIEGAGNDFTISTNPITIPAGETTAFIYVYLNNDSLAEDKETIIIDLGFPINATLGPQSRHTIEVIDPPIVSFSTSDQSKLEHHGQLVVTVELSRASIQEIFVPILTSGSAEWGSNKDYTTSSLPIIFPPGLTSRSFIVTINDDNIDEYDEQAILTIDPSVNALLGDQAIHTITIQDNDNHPTISFFTDAHIVSEEFLTFTTAIYTSNISGKYISIPYTIKHITTSPDDISILTPSPLIIPPGNFFVSLQMNLVDGDGVEADESFEIVLGTPENAKKGSITTQSITVVESITSLPQISFSTNQQLVNESQSNSLTVNIQMDHTWGDDVTVYYTISGTSSSSGTYHDFIISPSSPVIIPAGSPEHPLQIYINDDLIDELEENIIITLDSAINGIIGTPSVHTVKITDDDPSPIVTFNSLAQTVSESDGTASVNIDVIGLTDRTITIPFTVSGTADQDIDFEIATSEITIPPYSTSGILDITILNDIILEPDEYFIISMGTPLNAELGTTNEHTIVISDNELLSCNVESYLLLADLDSISWSINNNGENVNLISGTIEWPGSIDGVPQLTSISFSGQTLYSGSAPPPVYSFTSSTLFSESSTQDFGVHFNQTLLSGEHKITLVFENPLRGDVCTLSTTYNQP
jgi:hypothetical protein